MIDLTTVKHHPAIDEIVGVICNRTQNTDRGFYDIEVAYFLGKMAASMRVTTTSKDRPGKIPVNVYALALATSGAGKGFSVNIMENEFLPGFKARFMGETFPVVAEDHMWKIAIEKAVRNSTEEKEEKEKLDKVFRQLGVLPFTFDSGTAPAVKQLRDKLLLANCGAINFQMDEIGSNLVANSEVMNVFLELYDQGLVKQKLTKNTNDNQRSEEIDGKTPANFLGFGTPSKLLDGGPTEDAFYDFLETGYARRCIFGIGNRIRAGKGLTAKDIYQRQTDPKNDAVVQRWHDHFTTLADPNRYAWNVNIDDDVAIEILQYKLDCEALAEDLPEHAEIQKAELSHRYFKAQKLAGIYAYVDESMTMEMIHFHQAVKLVEQSGECFQQILNRDKKYVKLAKFIAGAGTELTHADIAEQLPFYGQSGTRRTEMMTFANSWAFKNHIVITKSYVEGIELFKGETLEPTDLDRMIVSYAQDYAHGYRPERAPWKQMDILAKAENFHWANHHFKGNHRAKDNIIPGFNMVVLDIDNGTPLNVAQELMKEHTFMTYTTKRHQQPDEEGAVHDRFRMLLPMTHRLKLDRDTYAEFMDNLVSWVPFGGIDGSVNQPEKKWLSNPNAVVHFNEGELLDTLRFIPKTTKNEQFKEGFQKVANMDNLSRWFAERIATGDRNNQFIKFALALVDSGCPYQEVESRVLMLNSQIQNPLSEDELRNTVLVSAAKRLNGIP